MFYGCSSLTNINLSNFNVKNISDIFGIFFGCSSLTNINLSNLNINNVSKMESIFWGCSSLKKENIISNDEIIRDIKINQPTIKVKITYDFIEREPFNYDINTKLKEVFREFVRFFHLNIDRCYIIINGNYIQIPDLDKPLYLFISPLTKDQLHVLVYHYDL